MRRPPQHPHFINGRIRAYMVRLVHEDRNLQLTLTKALQMAEEMGMDLVQMNTAEVPTCKIMNYSKFLFELKRKKEKEAKNSKNVLKEVGIKPFISSNDLKVKAKQVEEFIAKGHDVKLKINLTRREKMNAGEHDATLTKFANQFAEIAKIQAGNSMGLILLKPIKPASK